MFFDNLHSVSKYSLSLKHQTTSEAGIYCEYIAYIKDVAKCLTKSLSESAILEIIYE